MSGLGEGSDGRLRCSWGLSAPDYVAYHDEEWGRPVTDDRGIYEKLTLEAFQSGLSWLTILRKRDNFRAAFDGFDFERGCRPTAMGTWSASWPTRASSGTGPRSTRRSRTRGRRRTWSPAASRWRRSPGRTDPTRSGLRRASRTCPSTTPESKALAKELKRRGFRFVGPTTAYALMQAVGIVNDHIEGCAVRAEVEAERAAAVPRP